MSAEPLTSIELPREPTLTDDHRRRGLFFLVMAVAAVGFAMVLQLALNSNFVAEEIGLK